MEENIGYLIGGSAAIIGVFSFITVFLVRLLFKNAEATKRNELDAIKTGIAALSDKFDERIMYIVKNSEKLELSIEKVKDRWLSFQRDLSTMEITRGNRLDALFSAVDKIKEEIATSKLVGLQKQKRIIEALERELKLYVQEELSKSRR